MGGDHGDLGDGRGRVPGDGGKGRDSAFARALEDVGRAIVSGDLPPGHAGSVAGLTESTGASRSVIREVVRVLASLGMLTARRRVGLTVLSREAWEVMDPMVVRWRLAGPDRDATISELRALRRAVEPAAAAEAARRVGRRSADGRPTTAPDVAPLLTRAEELSAATTGAAFAAADRAFHAQLLDLSGNMLFSRLGRVIEEVLEDRATPRPDPEDVALHRDLAVAIGGGEAASAEETMRRIIDRT